MHHFKDRQLNVTPTSQVQACAVLLLLTAGNNYSIFLEKLTMSQPVKKWDPKICYCDHKNTSVGSEPEESSLFLVNHHDNHVR